MVQHRAEYDYPPRAFMRVTCVAQARTTPAPAAPEARPLTTLEQLVRAADAMQPRKPLGRYTATDVRAQEAVDAFRALLAFVAQGEGHTHLCPGGLECPTCAKRRFCEQDRATKDKLNVRGLIRRARAEGQAAFVDGPARAAAHRDHELAEERNREAQRLLRAVFRIEEEALAKAPDREARLAIVRDEPLVMDAIPAVVAPPPPPALPDPHQRLIVQTEPYRPPTVRCYQAAPPDLDPGAPRAYELAFPKQADRPEPDHGFGTPTLDPGERLRQATADPLDFLDLRKVDVFAPEDRDSVTTHDPDEPCPRCRKGPALCECPDLAGCDPQFPRELEFLEAARIQLAAWSLRRDLADREIRQLEAARGRDRGYEAKRLERIRDAAARLDEADGECWRHQQTVDELGGTPDQPGKLELAGEFTVRPVFQPREGRNQLEYAGSRD
jgi:hypothetical protein